MSLYRVLDLSASGLAAQRRRVETLAENIANAETTRTPEGGPYRRRRVIFESAERRVSFDEALRTMGDQAAARVQGVRVARIEVDPSPPERRYMPDHPDADEAGYVELPSFNPVEDMVDLTASVRGYQANLAVIEAVKRMLNETIDVAR